MTEAEVAASRAAAAARRLDDAFRQYLAERGHKRLSLAEVASLMTGVAGLRLTAQAVTDLWSGTEPTRTGFPRAQLEVIVATERVTNWFAAMAQAMTGSGAVPRALTKDGATTAVSSRHSVRTWPPVTASHASVRAHTVRLVWTSDHVDTARRLQEVVEQPARTVST